MNLCNLRKEHNLLFAAQERVTGNEHRLDYKANINKLKK